MSESADKEPFAPPSQKASEATLSASSAERLRRNSRGRRIIVVAALLGATGVIFGAFGAHGLERLLSDGEAVDPEWLIKRLSQFEVGVRYHLVHAVAMLALAGMSANLPRLAVNAVAACWLSGVAIFSGMLYLLVLTDTPVLGAIVPIGGVLMIVGWIALGIGGLGFRDPPSA